MVQSPNPATSSVDIINNEEICLEETIVVKEFIVQLTVEYPLYYLELMMNMLGTSDNTPITAHSRNSVTGHSLLPSDIH